MSFTEEEQNLIKMLHEEEKYSGRCISQWISKQELEMMWTGSSDSEDQQVWFDWKPIRRQSCILFVTITT